MLKKLCRNRKGSVVVPALLGILIISMLGFTAMQYGQYDKTRVVREERYKQAYYMARSGLKTMEEYIRNIPAEEREVVLGLAPGERTEWSDLVIFEDVPSETIPGLSNYMGFKVMIERRVDPGPDEEEYIIYSKGIVGPTKSSIVNEDSSVVVIVELDNKDADKFDDPDRPPEDPSNPDPNTKQGTIVVNHIDIDTDELLDSETLVRDLGIYTVYAKSFNGYKLADNDSKVVELRENNKVVTVVFKYKKTGGSGTDPSIERGTIIVNHIDVDTNKLLASETLVRDLGKYTVYARNFNDYELVDDQAKTVELKENNETVAVDFKYKKVENPDTDPEAEKGTIIVKHIDIDTNETLDAETLVRKLGTHTVYAKNFNEYELVDEGIKTVELKKDNETITVVFNYKKIKDTETDPEPEAEKGTIIVNHIDADTNKVLSSEASIRELGKHTVYAKDFDGYKLVDDDAKTVELKKNNETVTVVFKYKKTGGSGTNPDTEKGTIIVNHIDADTNKVLSSETSIRELGKHTVYAKDFDGYKLVDDKSKTVVLKENNETVTVTFRYKSIENPGTDPGTDPGTSPGTNPGTDPGTNPGTNPGTDPDDDKSGGSGKTGGGKSSGGSHEETHGPAKPRNYGPKAAVLYSGKSPSEMPNLYYSGLIEPSMPVSFFGSEDEEEAKSYGSGSKIKFGSWYNADGLTYEDIDENIFSDIDFDGEIQFSDDWGIGSDFFDIDNFFDVDMEEEGN